MPKSKPQKKAQKAEKSPRNRSSIACARARATFSQQLAGDICERIACGESLRAVCHELGLRLATVCSWLAAHDDFAKQYAIAKEMCADVHAEDVIEYARRVTDPRNSDELLTPDQAKVAIAARQWAAGKLKPKKYGDKIAAEVTGKDGGPIEVDAVDKLELARRIAFLLGDATRDKMLTLEALPMDEPDEVRH